LNVWGRLGAALLTTLVVVGCSVDLQLAGLTDGGTPPERPCTDTCTCSGSASSCDFVCGAQTCQVDCTGTPECHGGCDGGACSFHCEGATSCTATCSAGPCTPTATPCGMTEEGISCTLSCAPPQACAADCRGNGCTAVCGALRPATGCDGGVYTCAAVCP
jgi:hypothetical protein